MVEEDLECRAIISDVMKKMKEKLKQDDKSVTVTLSEFIRLVQLDRELAENDSPKEIRVSWSATNTESDTEP